MIREKNYSLIKAIRESGCCSKDDSSSGGAFDIDSIVKSLDIGYSSYEEIPTFNHNYNAVVAGLHEYYCIATIPAQS